MLWEKEEEENPLKYFLIIVGTKWTKHFVHLSFSVFPA